MLRSQWHRFEVEDAVLEEIQEDYEHQADLERLCHQSDMLSKVHEQIGIFFAREGE
jgi:nucleoside diphosphate kinase